VSDPFISFICAYNDFVIRFDESKDELIFLSPKINQPEELNRLFSLSFSDIDSRPVEEEIGIAVLSFFAVATKSSAFELDRYRGRPKEDFEE
jgi:hypothetical protein